MIRYFRELLSGALPLSRVLWIDMIGVGTLINILTLIGMVGLLQAGAPGIVAIAMLLAPIPYNIALFAGVWRSAAREGGWGLVARAIAAGWLALAVVV